MAARMTDVNVPTYDKLMNPVLKALRQLGGSGTIHEIDAKASEKGLLVTTGNFSKDAIREAIRNGAPAMDLMDGDQLVDKLKELELGVHARKVEVEQVTVDRDWLLGMGADFSSLSLLEMTWGRGRGIAPMCDFC